MDQGQVKSAAQRVIEQQRAREAAEGRGPGKKDTFYGIPKAGFVRGRFLPMKSCLGMPPGHPDWVPGKIVTNHFRIPKIEEKSPSFGICFADHGIECPYCKVVVEFSRDSEQIMKDHGAVSQACFNYLILQDATQPQLISDTNPVILQCSFTFYEWLTECRNHAGIGDITDPVTGSDVTITRKKVGGAMDRAPDRVPRPIAANDEAIRQILANMTDLDHKFRRPDDSLFKKSCERANLLRNQLETRRMTTMRGAGYAPPTGHPAGNHAAYGGWTTPPGQTAPPPAGGYVPPAAAPAAAAPAYGQPYPQPSPGYGGSPAQATPPPGGYQAPQASPPPGASPALTYPPTNAGHAPGAPGQGGVPPAAYGAPGSQAGHPPQGWQPPAPQATPPPGAYAAPGGQPGAGGGQPWSNPPPDRAPHQGQVAPQNWSAQPPPSGVQPAKQIYRPPGAPECFADARVFRTPHAKVPGCPEACASGFTCEASIQELAAGGH